MKFLLSLIALLVITNSCNSSKKAIEKSSTMTETLSGTYYITQLGNNDVSANKLVMTFDEKVNKVTGFAGCNSFFGNYNAENTTITLSGIASSKKMCQKSIFAVETEFLKLLKSANSFSINDNTITFFENDTALFSGTTKATTVANKSTTINYSDNTAVKYQVSSRNVFDFILISKDRLLVSKDQGLQNMDSYKISAEDWNTISKLIKTIDIETIRELTPPSTKHQFDGAAHTTLAIIQGDVEYMTPTFDQGNPPETIKALVNKVLSITKKAMKP